MSDTNLTPIGVVEAFHSIDLHIYDCFEAIGAFEFRIEFARLRDASGTLTAEVTVYAQSITNTDLPPKRLLGPMTQNLLAGTWERNVAQALEKRLGGYDWSGIFTEIIPTTIEKHRGMQDVEYTSSWEQQETNHPYLLKPFVAASGVTVLFGPGGTGKSTLAVAMALSVMTGEPVIGDAVNRIGPVLWVDYEAEVDEVFERELALRRGLGIADKNTPYEMTYIKVGAKFTDSASVIRRQIHETDAVLMVVDSVANARRGDAFGPEATVHMFAVMGSMGIPVLAIDHMSAEAAAKSDFTKPYGTVFTSNEARLTWGVIEAEMGSTPDDKQLNMVMSKQNRFKGGNPRGLVLSYESFPTGIVKVLTITENEGVWADGMTVLQRVLKVLRGAPEQWFMTHEIVDRSESNLKSVQKELKRLVEDEVIETKQLEGRGNPYGYREKLG